MKIPVTNSKKDNEVSASGLNGVLIFALVAALIIILIGLFYWYQIISKKSTTPDIVPTRPTAEMNKEPETTTATAQVESFGVLSTSDEISALEADIASTDLSNLETELGQIDAELQAAVIE